jgi:non-heme chloroperoxidase
MNFIETNKDSAGNPVNINYVDYGKGNPVILIHGWPLSGDMWEYQIESLVNSGHRVVVYDRRGFGKSSRPWDGYDYDTMTDDLKALIDQLQLDNITLVGFSMGGGEVVRYFSRHGGKGVSKAVLISSVTPYLLKTDSNPDGVPKDIFDGMAEDMKKDRIAFLDGFGKTFFGVTLLNKPVSSDLLEYYKSVASMASPRATLECAKAFSTTDFRSEMASVKVPTLIIHGDADKTVPIDPTGKEAAKAIADNQFVIYEGAPHGLFYTEKERLNQDLLTFLQGGKVSAHQRDGSEMSGEGVRM